MKHLIDWSPIGLFIVGALAIGGALLKVAGIDPQSFRQNGMEQLIACAGCPEPPCPSPFPGICEDS